VTDLYGAWVLGDPSSHGGPDERPRCSAKGCRAAATWQLHWRNPRLHDSSRVKTWLACAEHADSLADFLSIRGFLIGREPLG
jgi:hypothetical protein